MKNPVLLESMRDNDRFAYDKLAMGGADREQVKRHYACLVAYVVLLGEKSGLSHEALCVLFNFMVCQHGAL